MRVQFWGVHAIRIIVFEREGSYVGDSFMQTSIYTLPFCPKMVSKADRGQWLKCKISISPGPNLRHPLGVVLSMASTSTLKL